MGRKLSTTKQATTVPTTTTEETEIDINQSTEPEGLEFSDSSSEEENLEENSTTSDSSDAEDYFDTAVSSHLRNIIGGNVAQFQEPISTSSSAQVKKSPRKKIWCNKFVDFAPFLPSANYSSAGQFSVPVELISNINVVPTKRQNNISKIDNWTSALLRLNLVYTEKVSEEAPALMKYAEIVRDLAARSKG